MNILGKVTWKTMWKNRTRTIVTIIGVILASAMFTAVTTMGTSLRNFLIRGNVYEEGDYYVQFAYATQAQKEALLQEPAVTRVADYGFLGFSSPADPEEARKWNTFAVAAADQTFLDTMPVHLIAGRMPQNSTEAVLPESAFQAYADQGTPVSLGDTITLTVSTQPGSKLNVNYLEPEPEEKTFLYSLTVVGEAKDTYFGDYDLMLNSILTLSDGQEPALWHRLCVKTNPASAALALTEQGDYGRTLLVNSELLNLNGATQYANWNEVIVALCGILMAIIMVGAVSLIYSAFSISVSERTKQFGLLSSVGATRRQIRRSVLLEAAVVCLLGIPIGLLAGYGGIAVTLHFVGQYLDSLFSFSANGIHIVAEVSPASFLAAAGVSCFTVFLSAWIPALRAMRVSALEAIRQNADIKVSPREAKVSKMTYRLFGLSGVLAKKYFKGSRKKYRATILSLAASVILLISAGSFSMYLRGTADSAFSQHPYDLMCAGTPESWQTDFETIRQMPQVTRSAYYQDRLYEAVVPMASYSEDYRQALVETQRGTGQEQYDLLALRVYYLEDATLEDYLQEQGIDPAPYLDAEQPLALVCNQEIVSYVWDDSGDQERKTYRLSMLDGSLETLTGNAPAFPLEKLWETPYPNASEDITAQGERYVQIWTDDSESEMEEPACFLQRITSKTDGSWIAGYYAYDEETGAVGEEPVYQETVNVPVFLLGARVDELPFGVEADAWFGQVTLILPYSALPGGADSQGTPYLTVQASNHRTLAEQIDQELGERVDYTNYAEEEENDRGFLMMIDVFSYGFIILIALIAAANVFNTISTNVALRRRDFAMLRSMGMTRSGLSRMMNYECLFYGARALLYGLPVSVLISFLIWKTAGMVVTDRFQLPWTAVAAAVASVFLVVFITMLYAMNRIKRENPLDALRNENI